MLLLYVPRCVLLVGGPDWPSISQPLKWDNTIQLQLVVSEPVYVYCLSHSVCWMKYCFSFTNGLARRQRFPKEIKLCFLKIKTRGASVAQSVERLTSAQVKISRSVSSSPASGSVLTAQSLEPVSDSVSPSLSAPPLSAPLPPSLSLSKINKH